MDTTPENNLQPPIKKMRWLGFFMLAGGCGLGYFSVVMPLLAASRHEDDVSVSLKIVMLSPALIVFGLLLFFLGNDRTGQLFGSRQKPSALGLVICVVTAVVGILLYEWLNSRLRAYGYGV